MQGKKKILFQAVAASAVLTFVGVSYNAINLTASAVRVEPVSIEVAARPMPPTDFEVEEAPAGVSDMEREHIARERARVEHGEEGAGMVGERMMRPAPVPTREAIAVLPRLDRGTAMKRVEDIHHRLDEPEVPPEEREMLQEEMDGILSEHFPKGGSEEPVQVQEDRSYEGLDINNIFNKVWGLLQGIILAWIPYALNRKKE